MGRRATCGNRALIYLTGSAGLGASSTVYPFSLRYNPSAEDLTKTLVIDVGPLPTDDTRNLRPGGIGQNCSVD